MAAEENKLWGKDWWADIMLTLIVIFSATSLVEIMKGKYHRWGEHIHGHRQDGSHVSEHSYNHPKHKPKKLAPKKESESADEEEGEESEHFARK